MSNMFQEVLTDAKAVEEKYLGPDYPYYKYIKLPDEIGMSSKGDLNTLGKDIDGLIAYVELLVSGDSKASATGGPLGNKYFLQTGAECTNKDTWDLVDRYVYVDNVPAGNIPFISQGLDVNFTEFRGLIPGVMSNMNAFNPFTIMQSFLEGSNPDCQEITMETIDVNNNKSNETHFVTKVDISNLDPCIFPDKKNPVTGTGCRESFQSITPAKFYKNNKKNNVWVDIYLGTLGVLLIWLLVAVNNKKK